MRPLAAASLNPMGNPVATVEEAAGVPLLGMDGVSDDCSVGLIHLPAGSEMPQHGEDAHVVGRR